MFDTVGEPMKLRVEMHGKNGASRLSRGFNQANDSGLILLVKKGDRSKITLTELFNLQTVFFPGSLQLIKLPLPLR